MKWQRQTQPFKKLTSLCLATALASCSWLPFTDDDDEYVEPVATLADINPAIMPDKSATLPTVDLNTLVATYRDVLDVTDDPAIRLQVLHRLAGLEMERGELQLSEQQATGEEFNLAIDAYQSLLKNNPGHANNDRLLYQLSKAYDLGTQTEQSMATLDQLTTEHPLSTHYAEAQFRRAEIFFSRADYRNAEIAYAEVISKGSNNHHYPNALYMHGWSQFKQERYRASLKSFSAVLDLNVPADNNLDSLARGQRELTQDAFRVMSVVFSYLDGPQTITEVYQSLGERHYLPLLYDNLGKLYLEKERYRDSAEAYRTFIDKYPQSDQSPAFYASLINAYREGGFPENVLEEKENYIVYYGIHSDYWQQKTAANQGAIINTIRPSLKKYLPELARHYHAQAQRVTATLNNPVNKQPSESLGSLSLKPSLKPSSKSSSKVRPTKKLTAKEIKQQKIVAIGHYLKAGDYYQEFIDTFPDDGQVPEIYFLLAESRFEAQVYDRAIEAYEIVAYKYPDHKRGTAAGYSAIIAYGHLLEELELNEPEANKAEHEKWLRLKIASQLRFANTFQDDARASAVLVKSAEELLALEEYPHALQAAQQLTRKQPPAEKSLRKTAWLVIGHSEFELQSYASAEQAYQQTLAIMDKQEKGRADIIERLAASVYKQAELASEAGNSLEAANQFLRVAEVAPTAAISVTAQYDAANTLMASASYLRAIEVLERFRNQHPDNPLAADIPAKMVVAYQESEQWAKAATELTAIYEASTDEAVKKESLYQAAELYEKAGDKETAILRYRSYAHAYPDPLPIAMEAQFKLSALYRDTGQESKRRFWLNKMIAADKAAGDQRTERSRYLAAFSSSIFAEDHYQAFKQIRLTLPLKNSLKKKKKALSKVLNAYQTVTDYGVEQFATQATFRIGAIYKQLSADLMASERPTGLDALALEQYELLLEEQAFPFEEKAIDVHEANSQRSWQGVYDQWVKESFTALKELLPARYGKEERGANFTDDIY